MDDRKKECFVIMPISNHPEYGEEHFTRVYEHLISPACELAGFIPVRADDVINTNYIALDVIKKIVESEMVICDLSSQNPNVLYELGIRQAFDKPIALIKDKKTKRIFDIQGFRDFEYDESLRVDKVEAQVKKLAEVLTATYKEDGRDINSLVSLLGLNPAKVDSTTNISRDTELILNSIALLNKRMDRLEEDTSFVVRKTQSSTKFYGGTIPPPPPPTELPNDVGEILKKEDHQDLKPGDPVYSTRFGYGTLINKAQDNNGDYLGDIDFGAAGHKRLLFKLANLRKVIRES